jgi:hypothetical protein
MQITLRTDSPLVAERARNHASGIPKRHEITAAIIDVCSEINKASLVDFWDNISPRSDHGTRTNMETNGSATKSAATVAKIFNDGDIRCFIMVPRNQTWIAEFQ